MKRPKGGIKCYSVSNMQLSFSTRIPVLLKRSSYTPFKGLSKKKTKKKNQAHPTHFFSPRVLVLSKPELAVSREAALKDPAVLDSSHMLFIQT